MLSPPTISMCDGGFLAQKNDYPPYRRQRVRAAVMGDGAFAANQDSGLLTDDEADDLGMRRPATSVYQLLSDEQIANIHAVADALFNVLDRNGDEAIEKEELACHLLLARYTEEQVEALFDLLDVNNDGSVSRVELREAFVRYPPLRSAPGIGSLSKSQRCAVHAEADATFEALDLDGNGSLSLEELQAHFASREGPTFSAVAVENIFRTLDANGDGQISTSEFRGGYVRYRAMRLALGKPALFGPEDTK